MHLFWPGLVPFPGQFSFRLYFTAQGDLPAGKRSGVISWKKQGEAIVGGLELAGGKRGNVVLVGPASNPKGATLIIPGDDPKRPQTTPLPAGCGHLSPDDFLDILCTQERGFGDRNFPAPGDID